MGGKGKVPLVQLVQICWEERTLAVEMEVAMRCRWNLWVFCSKVPSDTPSREKIVAGVMCNAKGRTRSADISTIH